MGVSQKLQILVDLICIIMIYKWPDFEEAM